MLFLLTYLETKFPSTGIVNFPISTKTLVQRYKSSYLFLKWFVHSKIAQHTYTFRYIFRYAGLWTLLCTVLYFTSWLFHDHNNGKLAVCLQKSAISNSVLYDSCLSTAHYDVLYHQPDTNQPPRRVSVSLQTKRARYQLWVELYGFCPRTKNSG